MSTTEDPLAYDGPLGDLVAFHHVARALTSSLDRNSVLNAILQQMERFLHPEMWTVLLVDEKRQDLYYAVAVGKSMADLLKVHIPLGEGTAGWVAEHGETLIVPELGLDPRFTPGAEVKTHGMRSAICVPLRSHSHILGVVQLFNCRLDDLNDYTLAFLHVLCNYAAIAVENARAMERIHELTITDDCTGLYNARHLDAMLAREIERARRFKEEFSLIFIDLDRFKDVNDNYGHQVGSQLLAQVGRLIHSLVRVVDSAFRYGGDEFVVLLPGTAKVEATQTALRLWSSLREADYPVSERLNVKILASYGVATFPEDGYSAHEIIGAADETMYRVKNSQRDAVGIAGTRL